MAPRCMRMVTVRRLAGGLSLLALASGCDQIFGIAEISSDAGVVRDARVPPADVTVHDAGADGASPDAGSGDATLPMGAFYVSTSGLDKAPCTMALPCKTIAEGVSAAMKLRTGVPTVAVCAGVYPEDALTITSSLHLLGGYDCTDWSRPLTASGAPSLVSTITNEVGPTDPMITSTLNIQGTAVRSGSLVDGFTILVPTTSTFIGVLIDNGAAPTLSHSIVEPAPVDGASPTECAGAATGVRIVTGSNVTLVANTIAACGTGSGGVTTDNSLQTVALLGNTIVGGSTPVGGQGELWAVNLSGTLGDGGPPSSFTLVGNELRGGVSNVLLVTARFALTLSANGIIASPGQCAYGAYISGQSSTATITANRVYGGTCTGTSTTTGMYVAGLVSPEINNNMILGGTVTGNHTVIGLLLDRDENPDVRFNTILGGTSDTSIAVRLGTGTRGATLEENILVGSIGSPDGGSPDGGIGLSLTDCDAGRAVGSFDYNAIANAPRSLLATTCEPRDGGYGTVTLLNRRLDGSVGNVALASECVDGGGLCIADPNCSTAPLCLSDLFASFQGALSLEAKALFPGGLFVPDAGCAAPTVGGYSLNATAPCSIARGVGADAAPSFSADLYGALCRNGQSELSLGASQNTAQCKP